MDICGNEKECLYISLGFHYDISIKVERTPITHAETQAHDSEDA